MADTCILRTLSRFLHLKGMRFYEVSMLRHFVVFAIAFFSLVHQATAAPFSTRNSISRNKVFIRQSSSGRNIFCARTNRGIFPVTVRNSRFYLRSLLIEEVRLRQRLARGVQLKSLAKKRRRLVREEQRFTAICRGTTESVPTPTITPTPDNTDTPSPSPSPTPTATPADGLIADFSFEHSLANAITAGPALTVASISAQFDTLDGGTGEALRLSPSGHAQLNGSTTVAPTFLTSFWISREQANSGESNLFSIGSDISLKLNAQGDLILHSDGQDTVHKLAAVNDEGWHHIALQIDAVRNPGHTELTIFIDGVENSSSEIDLSSNALAALVWGGNFTGRIDSLKIFNGLLEFSTIQSEFEGGQGNFQSIDSATPIYLSFEESSARNRSSGGNAPALTGSLSYAETFPGSGNTFAQFNGSQYLSLAAPQEISNTFTLSLWVQLASPQQSASALFEMGNNFYLTAGAIMNGAPEYGRVFLNNELDYVSHAGRFDGGLASGSLLHDGQWHQIVITVDLGQQSGRFKSALYVDGTLVSSAELDEAVMASDSRGIAAPFTIAAAREGWLGHSSFAGGLDEVRFQNQVLSANEVAALFNSDRPRFVDDN
jgi:Concanavalin A-like lectin/glucanases superfamily